MPNAAFNRPIPSPCVGICTLDETDHCVGCLRTADEIVRWAEMSPAERERIMLELPSRGASHRAD